MRRQLGVCCLKTQKDEGTLKGENPKYAREGGQILAQKWGVRRGKTKRTHSDPKNCQKWRVFGRVDRMGPTKPKGKKRASEKGNYRVERTSGGGSFLGERYEEGDV